MASKILLHALLFHLEVSCVDRSETPAIARSATLPNGRDKYMSPHSETEILNYQVYDKSFGE